MIHGFYVIRIATLGHPAKVVEILSARDGPNERLVGEAVTVYAFTASPA